MQYLVYSIITALIISLISLIGIFLVQLSGKKLEKILFWLISFSAGSLMGGAFFHLIPEALEENQEHLPVFKIVIFGFILFFIVERFLHWHHCHDGHCDNHKVLGYQNLIGDGVHNFIDGLIIISAFSVSSSLGVAVAISVALHEVPQEVGDFGVLLYSGFSKKKALMYNLFSGFLAVAGVIVGYFLINKIESIVSFLLPMAAGGFIYIAAADLIPELHKQKETRKSLTSFIFFILAIGLMLLLAHSH